MTADRARRLYQRLLRLAPDHLRKRYGHELEEAFVAEWARCRGIGRIWVWTRASADVMRARFAYPHRRLTRQERTRVMFGSEVRAAWRSLRRQRFASWIVVAMLALGIGANVVVFSLINDVFLKPFPFPHPEELIYVNETAPKWGLEETSVDFADFHHWRANATVLQGIALHNDTSANVTDARGAERVNGTRITYDFFDVLGVPPLLGRTFTTDEDRPNGAKVVLLSESMWRDRYGRDAGVLGQTLSLNGTPHVIVGVMPRRAEFPLPSAYWVPLAGDPNDTGGRNYAHDAIARAKPGVTAETVEQDLLRVQAAIWAARDTDRTVLPFSRPLRAHLVREYRTVAGALTTAVVLMLAVACANIAAVMLARAMARRREIGIRVAIGASRLRLVQQLLAENVILAAFGGVIGLIAGRWALRVLISSVPDTLPPWASFAFDWRVAAYSMAVTAAAALLFGCLPVLHAIRGDLRGAMTEAASGTTDSPRGKRTLVGLVAAEFVLAALLLAGAGLLMRAFSAIEQVDPGYRADHVLMFSASLPTTRYAAGQRVPTWERVLARLRASPGVRAAGIVNCPPLTCHLGYLLNQIEGREPLKAGEPSPVVMTRIASDGYFEAMGIRLAEGRFFNALDGAPGRIAPVVVNETFVRTYWPGESNVLGKRIAFNGEKNWTNVVIGVAGDVKHYGLDRPVRPGVYFPARQLGPRVSSSVVVVRTTGDPMMFVATARAIMREIDPEVPLYQVTSGEQLRRDHLRTRAAYSWLLAVLAGTTLVLALGGTYGVTSYMVAQRRREIGIRMAIGARGADITRTIFRSSAPAMLAGVALGLLAATYAARHLTDLLFGIPPHDPLVLAGAASALLVSGLAANWIPARRAARTNPISSLRA